MTRDDIKVRFGSFLALSKGIAKRASAVIELPLKALLVGWLVSLETNRHRFGVGRGFKLGIGTQPRYVS